MRIYVGFDDTDDKDAPIGTGRLVREFVYALPEDYHVLGVVRHQLPRLSDIPFTSNNSSACAIIDIPQESALEQLRTQAIEHILNLCAPGSDPGLCIAKESEISSEIIDFSKTVTGQLVTQQNAMDVTKSIDLMGLGGTNDGIIGATAAIGLTKFGWCGRFIEYGKLRDLSSSLHVYDLNDAGIQVVSVDRDPLVPLPGDLVQSAIWIRPSLWAGSPVLQVQRISHGVWEPAHGKRKKGHSIDVQPKSTDAQHTAK
ncbi:hypothetical protein [Maridesulfovibrio frigidus]|uniref:hypothetical protein n=1 Tax=Maridesulfovibrio frigidus TaxID=340956 RepID=UPI00055425CE|nr:hypothetical protein [Maridesulfovibrio frigidus]